MATIQWIIAAGTSVFVALVGLFQWRTAQHKAVLDLFDRRHAIYEVVRKAVGQIVASSPGFDQDREIEFMANIERAYFFFGDDVNDYLKELWEQILNVRTADSELKATQSPEQRRDILTKRRAAFDRVEEFYKVGQPLFAKYMRFSQTIPRRLG
jgi:hypothetical protein